MTIPRSIDQLQLQSYKESTVTANQPGIVVVNSDGSAVGSGLPPDAATETTLATLLTESTFTTRVPVNGAALSANSIPVVIASDQSPVEITGNIGVYSSSNATDFLKAEDAQHSSGDYGSMALAVRKDTAAALAGTDGDYIPLITGSLGHLHVSEGFAPQAEDNTNGVIATVRKLLAGSTYACSIDKSAALEASSVSKATTGTLLGFSGRLDSTLATGTYYLHFGNHASLPADGAVTLLVAPTKIQHTTGTDTPINLVFLSFSENGVYASTGITWWISTTEFTKTIGGAYVSGTLFYI